MAKAKRKPARKKPRRRRRLGPAYSVETHPKQRAVIADLARGRGAASVAKKYGLARSSVLRYLNKYLAPLAAQAVADRDRSAGQELLADIEHVMGRMRMLYDACHEYLQDPTDPTRYELGPRGTDIDVVYKVDCEGDKPPYRERASLQSLLSRIERKGIGSVVEVRSKHADPRELIVKTAEALTRQLQLVAKVHGLVKETTISIIRIEEWVEIKAVILDATKDVPEVRQRIVDGLARVVGD